MQIFGILNPSDGINHGGDCNRILSRGSRHSLFHQEDLEEKAVALFRWWEMLSADRVGQFGILVSENRDLMREMVREALQSFLETEMTEFPGASLTGTSRRTLVWRLGNTTAKAKQASGDLQTRRHLFAHPPDPWGGTGDGALRRENCRCRQKAHGTQCLDPLPVKRRGYNRTAVANKNARLLWALLTKEEAVYSPAGPALRKTA